MSQGLGFVAQIHQRMKQAGATKIDFRRFDLALPDILVPRL